MSRAQSLCSALAVLERLIRGHVRVRCAEWAEPQAWNGSLISTFQTLEVLRQFARSRGPRSIEVPEEKLGQSLGAERPLEHEVQRKTQGFEVPKRSSGQGARGEESLKSTLFRGKCMP